MNGQSQTVLKGFIGIDWADREDEVFIMDEYIRSRTETLEQSRGALAYALMLGESFILSAAEIWKSNHSQFT